MTALWLGVLFFLFVMGAVIAAGYLLVVRTPETAGGPGFSAGGLFESMGAWVVRSAGADQAVRKRLAAAGYTGISAVRIFYGVKCAAALTLFFTVALVAGILRGGMAGAFLPALCGAAFGYYLPARILARRKRARMRSLQRGLPTALDLYVLSLEAGQTLDQAMLETSRGLTRSFPELGGELEQVYLETRASNDRTMALRSLAERTEEPEVRKVVSLLIDADRFGTSIVPALRNHSKYLRLRLRQSAHETARKIGVKLIFPIFFLIFPAVILITLGPACIMVFTQLNTLLNK